MKTLIASSLLGLLASFATLAAEQTERPFTTAYRYNLQGQVTGVISPDPDGSGPLRYLATRTTYDRGLVAKVESGELQYWVNEDGEPANWEQSGGFTRFVITEYSYDSYGRKTAERVRRGDTGEIESLVQFNYDSGSRVLCRAERMNKSAFASPPDACSPGIPGSFGPDRITRYTYDNLDQVLTEERGVGTSLQQTYVRNVYGGRLLLSQTDANGNKTELRYDDQKRLLRRVYPSRSSPGLLNERDYEEFTYELTGKLKTARKRGGQIITYTYDANNRVRIKDLSDNTYSPDVYFDYYPHGARRYARFGSASGPGILDEVDALGRIRSTLTNTAQATSSSGPSRRISYAYDENGNRVSITHPDGVKFGYAFDGLNRNCGAAESVVPSCGASQIVVGVTYRNDGGRKALTRVSNATTTYLPDGVGRLQQLAQDFSGTANDLTNSFDYSPANQISRFTQSNASFAYAGNANRAGEYARNGLNQVTSVGGLAVLHDANGNLTTDPGLGFTMAYDLENHLVATSGTAATTASLTYDPAGRLSRIGIGTSSTEFLYDGDALIAEYQNGALTRRYLHGDRVDEPWAEYAGSAVTAASRSYLLADQQGSIIARTDSTGSQVQKLAYDSFGSPREANGGRFGFTGQAWIPELGLYYYKARIYSPGLGRFLQADPVGYADNFNLYGYVGNDPINRTDPTGLEQCPDGKSKCTYHGTPQKTNGRNGQAHAESGVEYAQREVANGDVKSVHYNQSLRTVAKKVDPNIELSNVSNKRADVTLVSSENKISVHEDSSPSQTNASQQAKAEGMLRTLPENMRGNASATPVRAPGAALPEVASPIIRPGAVNGLGGAFMLYEIIKWAVLSERNTCETLRDPSCA